VCYFGSHFLYNSYTNGVKIQVKQLNIREEMLNELDKECGEIAENKLNDD